MMKFKQKNWSRISCDRCGCTKLILWNHKKDRTKQVIGCPECGGGYYLNHKKKIGRELRFEMETQSYIG